MNNYCEEFNPTNQMTEDPENDNVWIRTTSISPFTGTWNRDYCYSIPGSNIGIEIPAGTRGYVTPMTKGGQLLEYNLYNYNIAVGVEVITWECLEYSALDYFTFEASFTYQFPDSGEYSVCVGNYH